MSERRRYPRIPYAGMVFISWKTFDGHRNHVLGRALNVSQGGIVVDLATRIPVGSLVKVRAYGLNLDGLATVKRVSWVTVGYVLGLELSKAIDSSVLAELSASPTQLISSTFNATAFFH